MKKVLVVALVLAGAAAVAAAWYMKARPETLVVQESEQPSDQPASASWLPIASPASKPLGGDQDENGCIGSAGYSWCEPKSKCLRIWEEACYSDVGEEIQYLIAAKYDKPARQVAVTVGKQDGDFASGGVTFGAGGPGESGSWLAKKFGNRWEVVFDGNGSVDCLKLRQEFEFPDSILKPNWCD